MTDFEKTFLLKQHTPLIHFQHFKEATIRPTEFKSKLDRFLIGELCQNWGNEKQRLEAVKANKQIANWLTNSQKPDHPAFEYQVDIRIVSKDATHLNDRVWQNNTLPTFFANMSQTGAKRKVFKVHRLVFVRILSCHDDLLEEIEQLIPAFLMSTNFGTRQTKGFGSYYLHIKDANYKDLPLDYYFDLDIKNFETEEKLFEELFSSINLFYKTLRSGINESYFGENGIYFKSLMWKYVKEKKEEIWDKKAIKQHFFPIAESTQKRNHGHKDLDSPIYWEEGADNDHLWRDLLGLSTSQDWKLGAYNNDTLSKTGTILDDKSVPIYSRFKSPIYFKPIRTDKNTFRIYFAVTPAIQKSFANPEAYPTPESEILGEIFNLEFSRSKQPDLQLQFPDSFDFKDFIEFCIKTNLDQLVRKKGKDRNRHGQLQLSTFNKIKPIFKQLKDQLNPINI